MDTALTHWLTLLWARAPALQVDAEGPYIAGGAIHLPPADGWRAQRAAAAHATAHLVYSPGPVEATGLVPLARALWALLEDARVEALAARELPGLWRLWRPLHTTGPDDGTGADVLLRRLARALADPAYHDPHPWVRKGRVLFYLDEAQEVLALHAPADLRRAACRLGHDLGQMRRPFNARGRPALPAYRDDHRWMWLAEDLAAAAPPPEGASGDDGEHEEAAAPPVQASLRYPEWDRLIGRLRRDWATVIETPPVAAPFGAVPSPPLPLCSPLSPPLRSLLRTLTQPASPGGRVTDGEAFDPDALVGWAVARRQRVPADARVHRGIRPRAVRGAVWLLIDHSASTAATRPGGATVLRAAIGTAAALASALARRGVPCAIAGFRSSGRHAVRVSIVKPLGAPFDAGVDHRLQSLRPEGSTRLGAALRHASARLRAMRGHTRWVLLLTDGHPHDIDVHDPRYLADDARQAVREAARRSVQMACLAFGVDLPPDRTHDRHRDRDDGTRRIFPRHRVLQAG